MTAVHILHILLTNNADKIPAQEFPRIEKQDMEKSHDIIITKTSTHGGGQGSIERVPGNSLTIPGQFKNIFR